MAGAIKTTSFEFNRAKIISAALERVIDRYESTDAIVLKSTE